MPKKGHSEEQIWRHCTKGKVEPKWLISAAAWGSVKRRIFVWKKKYAGLGVSELRELRQLREENCTLKRLVADLFEAVHLLLSGRKYLSGTLAEHLAAALTGDLNSALHKKLSPKERVVFDRLVNGFKLSQIAEELSINIKKASTSRSRLRKIERHQSFRAHVVCRSAPPRLFRNFRLRLRKGLWMGPTFPYFLSKILKPLLIVSMEP